MFKSAILACAMLASTVAVAGADPTGTPRPPSPSEGGVNVPGMDFTAERGQSCNGKPIFGRGPEGETLVCVFVDDENSKRQWVRSAPLIGVRTPGSSCSSEGNYVAMSPKREGMVCGTKNFDINDRNRTWVWMIGDF